MSVKTKSDVDLKSAVEFSNEYSFLFDRYFRTLIKIKNIVPFYVMEDNFKKILIQYIQRKKNSIIFGDFCKNKLITYVSNFMVSFYIYNDNEKEFTSEQIENYLSLNNLDFMIIFNFSIKDLKSNDKIKSNNKLIVIDCSNAYENYFIKNKTSQQIVEHIDEYRRVLACHYYQYLHICIKSGADTRDRRVCFKTRFTTYLDRIFDNAKINHNRNKYTDGVADVIKVRLAGGIHLSILFNVTDMDLLKDPPHKRLAMLPLDKLGYSGGIKILINSCQDIKKYIKYYTSEEVDVITSGYFYQILVKEVPMDKYPKVIR